MKKSLIIKSLVIVAFLLIIISSLKNFKFTEIKAEPSVKETVKEISSNGIFFIGGAGTYRIVSKDNLPLENVKISCSNSDVVLILDNLNITQKADAQTKATGNLSAFFLDGNNIKVVLVGENTIRVDDDSIIRSEALIEVTDTSSVEFTTMQDASNTNINGKLTLYNSANNYGASIGGSGINRLYESPRSGGEIIITKEAEINIHHKGYAAAIGGAASNTVNIDAASGNKFTMENGTLTIYNAPTSHGASIGGGAAVFANGLPLGAALSGNGSEVVITGGSLYIQNDGNGEKFGRGSGNRGQTSSSGSLTNGKGEGLCLYIAQDALTNTVGQSYNLMQTTGEQEYSYNYIARTETMLNETRRYNMSTTVQLLDLVTYYDYKGNGHQSFDSNISTNVNTNLYFYLPASERIWYKIDVSDVENGLIEYELEADENRINSNEAQYGTQITVDVEANADYIIESVFYIDNKGKIVYLIDEGFGYKFQMPDSDIKIGAIFYLPEYNITYKNDFGVFHNNPIKYTARTEWEFLEPVVTGYEFIGWFNEIGNQVYTITKGSTGDFSLTARWTKQVYNITFVDYDDTFIKSQTVEAGNAAVAPSNPFREGYLFVGWDKSYNNISSNLTIKALYEKDPDAIEPEVIKYSVILDTNIKNGVVKADKVTLLEKGEAVTLIVEPEKGYRLVSIDCKSEGAIDQIVPASSLDNLRDGGINVNMPASDFIANENTYKFFMPESDVLVSATFEKITYSISYVLNKGINDPDNKTTYTITDGFDILPATKENIKFLGWETITGQAVEDIKPGSYGNLILIANWEEKVVVLPPNEEETTEKPTIVDEIETLPKDEIIEETSAKEKATIEEVTIVENMDDVTLRLEASTQMFLQPGKYEEETCLFSNIETLAFEQEYPMDEPIYEDAADTNDRENKFYFYGLFIAFAIFVIIFGKNNQTNQNNQNKQIK